MSIYNSTKFPSGKLLHYKRGFFAVRGYGDYEVTDYSKDTLVPEKTTDNFETIQPFLLKFGKTRYYIGSTSVTGQRVKKQTVLDEATGEVKVKEVGEEFEYLPVYSSLNFGSQCIARLYKVEGSDGLWIGSISGYTVLFDSVDVHEYIKKDSTVLQYYVAEISKCISKY